MAQMTSMSVAAMVRQNTNLQALSSLQKCAVTTGTFGLGSRVKGASRYQHEFEEHLRNPMP